MNNYFAYPVAAAAGTPTPSPAAQSEAGFPVPPIEEGGAPVAPSPDMGFPVPPIEDGGAPVPPDSNFPMPPIEEGGFPVYPDGGYPVPPIEEGGFPVYPDGGYPVPPIAPTGGLPVYPNPGQPSLPNRPGFPGIIIPVPPSTGYAEVRFLHGAINSVPVTISIGSRTVASDLRFGNASDYTRVPDGFRTVTVMTARSPRSILYRQNIPFRAGERMTIAIVNASNGIELMTIPDDTCVARPQGYACFRMVNLSYNSMPVDLILYDGRIVFADVRYKEITPYRRARTGEYGFYVAVSPASSISQLSMDVDIETVESMPIAVNDNYVPGYGDLMPLTTFYEYFRPGVMYTAYLIGVGGNNSYPYTVVTLQTKA